MSKLFDLDNPIMRALNRIADLMWLNLMTEVFFLPGFAMLYITMMALVQEQALNPVLLLITVLAFFPAGAAMTGMHYVLLHMVRNEESYVTKSFFKSFKENFKQATIMWLIVSVAYAILLADFMIIRGSAGAFPQAITVVIAVAAVLLFVLTLYAFPMLSRFVNTIPHTFRNSLLMSIMGFPRTLGMIAVSAVPWILLYFLDMQCLPLLLMFGLTGPGYVCAMLYSGLFKKFEPEEEVSDPDAPLQGLDFEADSEK